MQKQTLQNHTLYALEGISCILIVFCHFPFPGKWGLLTFCLCRFVVPLFFLISGYYLFAPDMTQEDKKQRLKNKVRRIGMLLLLSVAVYLAWTLLKVAIQENAASAVRFLRELAEPRKLFAFLVLNDVTEIGGHLWFLGALLYSYGILFLAAGRKSEALIVRFWPLPLAVHLLLRIGLSVAKIDSIGGIDVYRWVRNWAFTGLPFLAAGIWIRRNEQAFLNAFPRKRRWILLITGIFLTVLEEALIHRFTGEDRELYFGTFPILAALFAWALACPEQKGLRLWEQIAPFHLHLYCPPGRGRSGLHAPGKDRPEPPSAGTVLRPVPHGSHHVGSRRPVAPGSGTVPPVDPQTIKNSPGTCFNQVSGGFPFCLLSHCRGG